jgi:16S rRNA (uracil1498-N3)-methyltransferase
MMHRFFLPSEAFTRDAQDLATGVTFPGPIAHQLRDVLRLRPGAQVIALDGSGFEYVVELIDLQGDIASARVCEGRRTTSEPHVSLTLYQSLLKGQRFEWVLQKGTELGVSAFVPVEARRTVALGKRWANKRARMERIVREAAEQSGRGRLPRLDDPLSFESACRQAATCTVALMPTLAAASYDIRTCLRRHAGTTPPQTLALLIGPEGGFDEDEVDLAQRVGLEAVTLGPRTLRAETAALAATTIVLAALGEMQ